MKKIKLPFEIGLDYEDLEFDLEVLKHRKECFDNYIYVGKKAVKFGGFSIEKVELIFHWDILRLVILSFKGENKEFAKQLQKKFKYRILCCTFDVLAKRAYSSYRLKQLTICFLDISNAPCVIYGQTDIFEELFPFSQEHISQSKRAFNYSQRFLYKQNSFRTFMSLNFFKMTYKEKLTAIRSLMKEREIDAYIIPSSDPHISEYLPDYYKCIAWTSGFTGSAGTLVITQDFAGLWTDSRYFVQANEQLSGSGFELVKLKVQHATEYVTWIADKFEGNATVAFDGNLASLAVANAVSSNLKPLNFKIDGHANLLDFVWEGRPSLPLQEAYTIPTTITGQATSDKLTSVRQILKQKRATSHLISSLDDLAWILNIRGTDVPCNPVTLGFLFLDASQAILFINPTKLKAETKAELNGFGVEIKDYTEVYSYLKNLKKGETILIDPKRTCFATYDVIPNEVKILEDMNPSTVLKSVKNEVEINNERQAMANDGVALTKFFKWLEENVASGTLTEMNIADKLQDLRSVQPGFKDISFDTISGYKDHGALPHYKAEVSSNYKLETTGLLLVDSGGQYLTGTTDITRVIALGTPTQEEKDDYTIVLKGTIEGSMAIFPKGTRGYQIDAITRRPIWSTLRNYGHGTGHGVGFFLNVHEGPQVFNPTNVDIPVEVGMITSIEPGLYREGKHGIRIENLVLAKDLASSQFGDFMEFETLTICYISTDLVEKTLLDQVHIDWLNNYNKWVYDVLSPKLTEEEATWLKEKTKAI